MLLFVIAKVKFSIFWQKSQKDLVPAVTAQLVPYFCLAELQNDSIIKELKSSELNLNIFSPTIFSTK